MSKEHKVHYCACGCRLPVVVDIAALRYQLAAKSAEVERLRVCLGNIASEAANLEDAPGSLGAWVIGHLSEISAALAPRAEKPAGEGEK